MKIIYDILKEFQTYFPQYCRDMRNCSHHFDGNNLNIYHLENDCWSHTMMVLNSYINDDDKDILPMDLMAVTLICHDIGKIYTRKISKKNPTRVSFYGHGYSSVQPCIDFIYHLMDKGIVYFTDEQIYNIICVISNHIEYYDSPVEKRLKIYNNDKDLYNLFELLLKYDRLGSIRDYTNTPYDFNLSNIYYPNCYVKNKSITPKLTIYCGVPASGKDFMAITNNIWDDTILSYDMIRIREYLKVNKDDNSLFPSELYNNAFHYCNENNIPVEQILINQTRELLKQGKNVIICNTNVRKKARRKIISQFQKYYIEVVYVISDTHTMYERDRNRKSHNLGKDIINRFIFDQQIPMYNEGIDNIKLIRN